MTCVLCFNTNNQKPISVSREDKLNSSTEQRRVDAKWQVE